MSGVHQARVNYHSTQSFVLFTNWRTLGEKFYDALKFTLSALSSKLGQISKNGGVEGNHSFKEHLGDLLRLVPAPNYPN